MPELTPSADRYISAMLAREGRVPAEALDWVPEDERVELLELYRSAHQADSPVRLDEGVLVAVAAQIPSQASAPVAAPGPVAAVVPEVVSAAVSSAPTPPRPLPVDPAMYAAPHGSSGALLDSKPAEPPVPAWVWFLPLLLGLVGGLVGWIAVRDNNPRGGRHVLVLGVVVSVLSTCMALALMSSAAPLLRMSAPSTSWPATGQATGRPALYYFGTST